jgi:hypothetical protein
MKKAILTFGMMFLAVIAFDVNAQATAAPAAKAIQVGGAEISFEKEVHDYGVMEQNGNGQCEFVFTNTGTEPLLITNARGSCGCTVPDWPREPIAPGASSAIKVKYDTKRIGLINKSVTITSNAETSTKIIRIKGEVKAPAAGATPIKPVDGPAIKKG